MILSCINPCIKFSFTRSVFSPLRCHFYHVASCWASTFILFSSQAHILNNNLVRLASPMTKQLNCDCFEWIL
ncbi:hypothetical protein RF16_23365 [Salmonella enterica subsp. enterica]|nr:hypothetical protein [Salmonella enterica subsp. enterica]EEJ7381165.1 hypothetical protein [Salmonella enterica subsp. enterica]